MIDSRLAASAAVPLASSPALSGPRWTRVALIRATRSESAEPFADTTPQIPHIAKESRRGVGSTRALRNPRGARPARPAGGARRVPDRCARAADPVSDLPGARRPRAGLRARGALPRAAAAGRARGRPAATALSVGVPHLAARL